MESLGTVLAAASLDVMYLLAGRLRAVQARFPRRWLSLAAGVSVAYVFVDILPELGARNRGLVAAAGGELLFAEQRIYIAALAGFEELPRDDRQGRFWWFVLGAAAYTIVLLLAA